MDTSWAIILGFAAFMGIGSFLYVQITDKIYDAKEKKSHHQHS
jgi:tryptophan-rich sensory protein